MENKGYFSAPRPGWHSEQGEEVEETNVVRKAYKTITDRSTEINIRREALEKELRDINKEQTQLNDAAMALLEVLN